MHDIVKKLSKAKSVDGEAIESQLGNIVEKAFQFMSNDRKKVGQNQNETVDCTLGRENTPSIHWNCFHPFYHKCVRCIALIWNWCLFFGACP